MNDYNICNKVKEMLDRNANFVLLVIKENISTFEPSNAVFFFVFVTRSEIQI